MPFALLQEPVLLIFQLLDAGALHLRLALTRSSRLRVCVGGLLPARERLLAALELERSGTLLIVRGVEARYGRRQFLRQRGELTAVALDDARELAHLSLGLFQVRALTLAHFARVLDALLDPRDLAAGRVEALLDGAQRIGLRRLFDADLLDARLGFA